MYFRLKTTRSTPVLQLINSYRDDKGSPRQKILLSLGNINLPKEIWKEVAKEAENQMHGISTTL